MKQFILKTLAVATLFCSLSAGAESLIIDRSAEEQSFLTNAASKIVGQNTALWLQRKRPNLEDYLSPREFAIATLKARFADMEGAKDAMLADCLQLYGMDELEACSCALVRVDFNQYIQAEMQRIETGITVPYRNLREFQLAEGALQKVWEGYRQLEDQCKLPKIP